MQIKNTTIDFLTFNDGIIDLYETDENGEAKQETRRSFRFGNRTVGVKRYFAAKSNDIELQKVIHIHFNSKITSDMAAVIEGTEYKIIQVQHDNKTNPRCTVLSLTQRGLYVGDMYDVQ